jgi:hypothetical protein
MSRHHALHSRQALRRHEHSWHGHPRHPRHGHLTLAHDVKGRKLFIGSTGEGVRGLNWWLRQRRLRHGHTRLGWDGRRFWCNGIRDCRLGRGVEAQIKIEESG